MTIEEAQERILELETELSTVKTERETLSQDKETLARELESARTLNQKLFERVTTQETKQDEDDEGDDVQTCEDFAKNLSI